MNVRVDRVSIPAGSTVGVCEGVELESGERVQFAGDHRCLREVGLAISRAKQLDDEDELPVAEVEIWQLLGFDGDLLR